MKISNESFTSAQRLVAEMRDARRQYWPIWRQLASVYLPYIVPSLVNKQRNEQLALNPNYLTSEGLLALRTQTAGLMNGITSPTRPWFKVGIGFDDDRLSLASRQWLYSVEKIMYNVLAKSNFYNIMAMGYFDIGLFGSTGMQIYSDYEDVIRLQRDCPGEFYIKYDYLDRICAAARDISMPLYEISTQFGEANLPVAWRADLRNPASQRSKRTITQIVIRDDMPIKIEGPAARFQFRELYIAEGAQPGEVLSISGYHERSGIYPRWGAELSLGTSPGMDALADMLELQQLILKKGIGLEKLIDPPMLIDARMQQMPVSLLPGGRTYVSDLGEATGMRSAYTPQIPFAELRADINSISLRIRELFHNDLFKMISQLDTVRSATEIDARREEKLVLLAHFLERFENEALSPIIDRVFGLCQRADLFPLPPREIAGADIKIEYISILSIVQKAIAAAPLERLLAMVGQVASVEPKVLDIVNFDELVYSYGRDIGANPLVLRDAEALRTQRAQREAELAAVQATATAGTAIDAAKTLSETDVGGGANALQRLLS